MNIIFMGTPEFAAVSLEKLIDSNYNVKAVFTMPDKKKGRGQKMLYPPVKEVALKHNIDVYQPNTFKGIDNEFVAVINNINPDIIIVVAYGKMLPKKILGIPQFGCVNVHGSLLPKLRGAGPIQWSILNGDTITGITTMLMATGMDTGDMLLKEETIIGENETADSLYDRLSVIGADLLIDTIKKLKQNEITPIPQDDSQATYAPMLTKELSQIDFNCKAQEIHNKIRGLSSWPCAKVMLNDKALKIYESEIIDIPDILENYGDFLAGSIINTKEFIVKTIDNRGIKFKTVQYDTGKKMSGKDFLNGKSLKIGDRFD